MADALLKLPDDSANTGKQLDTTSLTVAAQTVHRERMTVAGATDVALAAVLNAAPTTDYGLVVRQAGTALVRENDGTNSETVLFDVDSGAGSQHVQGVSLRKAASGGSAEYGTSTDPFRTDPTGTTTQPVSGTVTANLSATDNAVLDAIEADTTTLAGAVAGTEMQVDVLTSALPAGAATLAEQQTQTTALQLIDDSVATLGTTTYTETTTKGLTVGAVRRDADTTLVGTTNEIGPLQMDANGRLKVEAFSGETLPVSLTSTTVTGTVAVTQSGTWDEVGINDSGNSITVDGITRTEYTVNAVAPTDPVGTGVVAERDDQLAALAEIEGDWTNLRASAKGALWVAIPDTNGDPITSFGGGTQYTEDVASAADPIGTALNLIRKDTPAALVTTDGDNVALRGTNYGAAFVQVVSSGGAFIDTFGGSGGTAQADESAFTEGTTNMTPIGGVLNDTITSDPTEDQAAAVRITAKRALHVNLRNVAGTEVTTFPTTGVTQVDASGGADTNVGYDSGNLNLPTQDVAGIIDDAAFTPAVSAIQMVGFEFDDAAPDSVNEGDGGAARMSANRNIYTTLRDAAGNERGANVSVGNALLVDSSATTQPISGTVTVSSISTSVVPGTGATNLGKAEDAAHTTGDVGVMALGVRAAAPTERSAGPTDGDYEPIAVNEVGAVWTSNTPSANGGLTIFRSIDLDETEEEVKATAGTVYGLWFTNTATATRWLKFYNLTAANTTVGTSTPVITIGLPGNTSDDISGLFSTACGIGFSTAITVAATTGVADADTGAPSANDVIVNIFFK